MLLIRKPLPVPERDKTNKKVKQTTLPGTEQKKFQRHSKGPLFFPSIKQPNEDEAP